MLVLEPEAFSSFLYYDQDMVGRLENESKLECFCRKKIEEEEEQTTEFIEIA